MPLCRPTTFTSLTEINSFPLFFTTYFASLSFSLRFWLVILPAGTTPKLSKQQEHFKNCQIKIVKNYYDMICPSLARRMNDELECLSEGKKHNVIVQMTGEKASFKMLETTEKKHILMITGI